MPRNVRVIARIDVKNEFAIKGIHLEGLRKVGDPNIMALEYYKQGADELLFMDAVAAYYDRNNLSNIIANATADVFVPITVGGGIRTLEDITIALESGADKVAINTQAIRSPDFVREAVSYFGSQCIVGSVDSKKSSEGVWHAYYDNGRESSGIEVCRWLEELQEAGVGEIVLTSVDKEGTKRGFDWELLDAVASYVSVPLQISGGAGNLEHVKQAGCSEGVDAIVLASLLHYQLNTVGDAKDALHSIGCEIRQ